MRWQWVWVLLHLYGCAAKTGPWHLDTLAEGEAQRWTHAIANNYRGVQLEFLFYRGERRATFNVFCIPFSASEEGEVVMAEIGYGDEVREVPLSLLTGGQKLLLPADVAGELYCVLAEGQCVEVAIGRYRATIPPFYRS